MNTAISYLGYPPLQTKEQETVLSNVRDLEESLSDVLEAFSQCSAAQLTYEQEQQIFEAYEKGDKAELGFIIHALIKKQLTEMAIAIQKRN